MGWNFAGPDVADPPDNLRGDGYVQLDVGGGHQRGRAAELVAGAGEGVEEEGEGEGGGGEVRQVTHLEPRLHRHLVRAAHRPVEEILARGLGVRHRDVHADQLCDVMWAGVGNTVWLLLSKCVLVILK